MDLELEIEENEFWWGGAVVDGSAMPLSAESDYYLDARINRTPNQFNGAFMSSKGRYVFFEEGAEIRVKNGKFCVLGSKGKIYSGKSGATLKDAHRFVAENYFRKPESFFDKSYMLEPQYCTWVETLTNVTGDKLIAYAKSIRDSGLSGKLLLVDDGWSKDYGDWRFDETKFPEAKQTLKQAKELGFDVVLWCVPFVNETCPDYAVLKDAGAFISEKTGEVKIVEWWNGNSAVLDMSKKSAREWLGKALDRLVEEYGVAGFKFDAGGAGYYPETGTVSPNEQCRLWAEFGTRYTYVELRECVGLGGASIAQRLCDKPLDWKRGLEVLIPDIIQAGMVGYYYCCADMVGGGNISDYADLKKFDEEFYIRSCQCAALFPMVQFSYALWRRTESLKKAVGDVCRIRREFKEYLERFIENARLNGEPIARPLEYEFPHSGFHNEKQCFMLGDKYLVAPVLQKGEEKKWLRLPGECVWKYLPDGKIYRDEAKVCCEYDILPIFEKQQ